MATKIRTKTPSADEFATDINFKSLYLEVCNRDLIGNSLQKYVEHSHESNPQDVSEIRILTNSVINYDCAALPLVSIQLNIVKGIKYIYYVPDSSQFETLLNKVIGGIRKMSSEVKIIDEWTRYYCSIAQRSRELVGEFENRKNDEVFNLLAYSTQSDARRVNLVKSEINSLDLEALATWIYCRGSVSRKEINTVLALKTQIKTLGLDGNIWRCKFLELLEHISKLWDMAEIIARCTKDDDECHKTSITQNDEKLLKSLKIPQTIIEWLKMASIDEETIRERLCVKTVNDALVCYNFCLILNRGGSINGASWYLTSAREQINVVDDNYVLLYLYDKQDAKSVKKAFDNLN